MKALVQTSFLGDAVLSLPMLFNLLKSSPEDVLLISGTKNHSLFETALERGLSEYRERIHLSLFDKRGRHKGLSFFSYSSKIKKQYPSIDCVFCVQRSFRSAFLANLISKEEVLGFSSGAASFLYTTAVKRDWDTGYLEIEKNLDLLREKWPEIPSWTEENSKSFLRSKPLNQRSSKKRLLSLSLGSPWKTKQWSVDNAIDLLRQLILQDWTVHLLGDPSTKELNQFVEKSVGSRLVKNFAGKTSISEWIDLIDESSVLLSGDSAAVHVAEDLGVPVIALFGPTVPELGFAPWRRHSTVLGLDLPCRPCKIHGSSDCPLKHHKCMKDLGSSLVLEALENISL